MGALFRIVTLAIIASFATAVTGPALPRLDREPDLDRQLTAYCAATTPALCSARQVRSLEAARKLPLLAVLASAPRLAALQSGQLLSVGPRRLLAFALALPQRARAPPSLC